MTQEIRTAAGDLIGYKEDRGDCIKMYDKYMDYLGQSNVNGTFDKYGAVVTFSQSPDLLLR